MSNLKKLRKFIFVFILLCSIIICGYLAWSNFLLNKALGELEKRKEKDFAQKLSKERQAMSRDFEEKYAADIVSYQAMAKRLEIEKQRVKELQAQINSSHAGLEPKKKPQKLEK